MKLKCKNQKRKLWESAETCLKKIVKSLQVNLFLADLSHVETTVLKRDVLQQCIGDEPQIFPERKWRDY